MKEMNLKNMHFLVLEVKTGLKSIHTWYIFTPSRVSIRWNVLFAHEPSQQYLNQENRP